MHYIQTLKSIPVLKGSGIFHPDLIGLPVFDMMNGFSSSNKISVPERVCNLMVKYELFILKKSCFPLGLVIILFHTKE